MAVALVVAAGRGERLGTPVPKAFVMLAGRPMIEPAFEDALRRRAGMAGLRPVAAPDGRLPARRGNTGGDADADAAAAPERAP